MGERGKMTPHPPLAGGMTRISSMFFLCSSPAITFTSVASSLGGGRGREGVKVGGGEKGRDDQTSCAVLLTGSTPPPQLRQTRSAEEEERDKFYREVLKDDVKTESKAGHSPTSTYYYILCV